MQMNSFSTAKTGYRCVSTRIWRSVPVPVPVPKNFWVQYRYQYQYSPNTDSISTSTSTTNIEQKRRKIWIFREKNQFFMREIQILWSNFELFWVWNWNLKRKMESFMVVNYFAWFFCCFLCFGTGTDWLSTCAISTSTESVLENWTSTSTSISTSVPKMISGLKKSVPVPVDWRIYSNNTQ